MTKYAYIPIANLADKTQNYQYAHSAMRPISYTGEVDAQGEKIYIYEQVYQIEDANMTAAKEAEIAALGGQVFEGAAAYLAWFNENV